MSVSAKDSVQDVNRNSKINTSRDFDVAIIGAGPYGLSAAAHLKAKGLGVCICDKPTAPVASKHLTAGSCHDRVSA